MRRHYSPIDFPDPCSRTSDFLRYPGGIWVAAVSITCLLALVLQPSKTQAATGSSPDGVASMATPGTPSPLAEMLGVRFIEGSTSAVLIERGGKTYVVDLMAQTIREGDLHRVGYTEGQQSLASPQSSARDPELGAKVFADKCSACHGADARGNARAGTPDFTSPRVQATLTDAGTIKTIREGKKGTPMPAWSGKLSEAEISAVASFVRSLGPQKTTPANPSASGEKQNAKVYEPADDYLYSLPTGRRVDRHGFYFNFTHRFAYNPAFTGPSIGNTLFGLDGYSISSFGLRFGVTDKLSVSAYRSPSVIGRPIELMAAYHLWDEHDGNPFNASFRISVDGQGDFSRNFTTNFEGVFSRSLRRRAQLYLVPTVSLQNRMLISKPGALSAPPPGLPGVNSFSLGFGGALDIRPSVALVAEVIPTLVNGPELGIHRPAYSFGIQKRVHHHAFTLGFSNSPGTVVSQRAGTRATFVGDPSADTPSGLFIGFDLMRQIY